MLSYSKRKIKLLYHGLYKTKLILVDVEVKCLKIKNLFLYIIMIIIFVFSYKYCIFTILVKTLMLLSWCFHVAHCQRRLLVKDHIMKPLPTCLCYFTIGGAGYQ